MIIVILEVRMFFGMYTEKYYTNTNEWNHTTPLFTFEWTYAVYQMKLFKNIENFSLRRAKNDVYIVN